MQSAEIAHRLSAWTKKQVIRIGQQYLDAKFFENVLRNSFYGGQRPDRHKDRRFNRAMGSMQSPAAGLSFATRLE
jgi:hypothetical protein